MNTYVLHCQTGFEVKIRDELRKKGFKASVVQEVRTLRSGGKWNDITYILFPSYIFVTVDLTSECYYSIKKIPHIIQFLGRGKPTPLNTSEQIIISKRTQEDIIEPSVVKILNNRVIPISGFLFENKVNILQLDKRQKRVKVEMTILGEVHCFTHSIACD